MVVLMDITKMSKKELKRYINKKMKENLGKENIQLTPQQEKALWEAKTKMMQKNSRKNLNNKRENIN